MPKVVSCKNNLLEETLHCLPGNIQMSFERNMKTWKIPWTEELGRLQSKGSQKSWK